MMKHPKAQLLTTILAVSLCLGCAMVVACDNDNDNQSSASSSADHQADANRVCECGDAMCGLDACGNSCGSCDGDIGYCLSGRCELETECPLKEISIGEVETAYMLHDKMIDRLRLEASGSGNDIVKLEVVSNIRTDEGVPLGPGTYELLVEGLTSCDLCVVAHRECNSADCQFPYVAESGFLEIDQIEGQPPRFAGRAHGLHFTQAYYDEKTKAFQPLGGGEPFCSEGFSFDTDLEVFVIEPGECSDDASGFNLGEEISNFEVQNCLGETINFHDNCGSKAVWLVAAAGW
jgi:hypothetical protein